MQSSEIPAQTALETYQERALPPDALLQKVKKAKPDLRYELTCDIQRSIRYHRAREAFFQWYANAFTFLMLVSGSGVVLSLLASAPSWISLALGATVAAVQALELVVQISSKARLHNSLASEFMALERVMVRSTEMDDSRLAEISSDVLTIEAREPPIKRYLDLICHNQVARSLGSDDIERLTFWQRHLAHWRNGSTALQ